MPRLAILLLVLFPFLARAQEIPADLPEEQRVYIEKVLTLQKEIVAAFEKKDYTVAETKCEEFVKLLPNNSQMHYDLACAQARQKKNEAALKSLAAALDHGFADSSQMAKDDDLATLHDDKAWKPLLEKAKLNHATGGAAYEKGADLPNVKTVEDFPDGGLRFRLRISPNATAEKPAKLILWLHPSGGSANRQVEALAPDLIKQGYALVVCTQKQTMSWTSEEAERYLTKTLPALAKIPGVDAKKPLLMGFSAGGQMALELWYQNPADFSGLILDATYPINTEANPYVLHDLPKNPAVKTTPIFALLGAKDPGISFWKSAIEKWTLVPLTFHTVPNAGHQWLFGKDQVALLTAWLAEVHAGKLPTNTPASQPATQTAPPSVP